MKTKLTLFVAIIAVALFGMGCASTEPVGISNGLVAHYTFDGNTKDASGNGLDAFWNGEPSWSQDRHLNNNSVASVKAKGYAQIIVPTYDKLKFDDNVTVSCWIFVPKLESGKEAQIYQEPETGLIIRALDHRLAMSTRVGRGAPYATAFSSSQFSQWNQWVHVGFTYDNRTITLYLNGKPEMTRIVGVGYYAKRSVHEVWERRLGGDKTTAKLDDVRIYNRALSEEEVKALYDLEKPKNK